MLGDPVMQVDGVRAMVTEAGEAAELVLREHGEWLTLTCTSHHSATRLTPAQALAGERVGKRRNGGEGSR